MPHCTDNFAWYLGKFIVGFTGMLFLYVGFLKEKEYSCVCKARIREMLRSKGENTNSCTLDDQADASVQKECGTKCMLADAESECNWFKMVTEWLWLQSNDSTVSESADFTDRKKASLKHNNAADPKSLNYVPSTSFPQQNKKSADSLAGLRRRRLDKCCPLRHCRRDLHTGRRKRKKAPSSVHLRVSQETLIDCWNIDSKKETVILKCDCKNSDEFHDDLEDDKELPPVVKQNAAAFNENENEVIDEFCGKKCCEALKECSTNIATDYNQQSTAKSQRQKINKADDMKNTEETIVACVDRSNSRNFQEASSKENVKYVQNSTEPFISKYVDQGNKHQDPDLINDNSIQCPEKINSCKCNSSLYDIESVKCEDTSPYVPKHSTKIFEETEENLFTIETQTPENNNTALRIKERQKIYSTGHRITSMECIGNSKNHKSKYYSKSDSENLKNMNVCEESNHEYETTRDFLDEVSVQLTRSCSTTSSSCETSTSDYENPRNDYDSSFALGKPFHSTEIEIDSKVQQKVRYPTSRKEISREQNNISKYFCKNCSTNTETCERSLFRTKEMSVPEASCVEKMNDDDYTRDRPHIINQISIPVSSYSPELYKKFSYFDHYLASERNASATDPRSSSKAKSRFSKRNAYTRVPHIDKSASVIFENRKKGQNESRTLENSTCCSLCLSLSNNSTKSRRYNKSLCQCSYRRHSNSFVSAYQRNKMHRASSSSSYLSSCKDCCSWRNFAHNCSFDNRKSTSCTNVCTINPAVKQPKNKCPKEVARRISFSSSSSSLSSSTSTCCKAKRSYSGRSTNTTWENPSEGDDTFEDETDEIRKLERKGMEESWDNRNIRSGNRRSVKQYKLYRTKYSEEVLRENEALKGRRKRRFNKRWSRVDDEPRFVCIPCDSVWEKIISVPE